MWGKIAVLLAVLLTLVGCQREQPAYESRYTEPPATTVAERPTFDVTSVNTALSGTQPYTVSVLGDSTGNWINEWVHLVAQRIAAAYERQVTVHDWNPDSGEYGRDTVYGQGAPVTIWNAAGPGESTQWSIQNFQEQVPGPVDLTIINHGHNDPKGAVSGIDRLIGMSFRKGTGGVVVLTQNPRIDEPGRAQLEADTYTQIRDEFNNPNRGTVVVDVFAAFPQGDALLPLLERDRVHPNEAGSRLWADAVATGLQLR
ncbi:Uncharacterised protein [Mycolicibacterium vanbaalenii]|uniref:PTS EIIA type-4 domain-containing protein n=1 Tax=Mycolicibacterium vanbaalenii TaxID=110539 RepID=A0A5S9MSB4_MYCVN|nr:SGNH/GDSL hydrolase family protein [Mycolicibacterium vanbaalenii]CAA0078343.1 Uncharacterised protein [Mycolicibacterium vanbaalenii]